MRIQTEFWPNSVSPPLLCGPYSMLKMKNNIDFGTGYFDNDYGQNLFVNGILTTKFRLNVHLFWGFL